MAYDELPNLGSGDVLTVGWVDQAEANAAAFLGIAQPVTSLPASPSQGDTVRYAPVAAGSPPIWLCTWDTNLNGGTGAWSVIGPPLEQTTDDTERQTVATTPGALTGGPSIVVPVRGVYIADVTADMRISNSTYTAYITVAGFTGSQHITYTSSTNRMTLSRAGRGTVSTTGGTAQLFYATTNALGTASFWRRRLALHPLELRP